jgi:signal transduction histidine kinase
MLTDHFLTNNKHTIIEAVLAKLASQEEIRRQFNFELNRFFDLLASSIEKSEYTKMDPILEDWSDTMSGNISDNSVNELASIIDSILFTVINQVKSSQNNEDGMEILMVILPIFSYCQRFISARKTEHAVEIIRNKHEEIQMDLARLEKSKANFISVAAHELRTPLTIIEGYYSIIRDTIGEERTHVENNQLLEGIEIGIRRLREIINNMVVVSLIDNNLLELNYQPIWIHQLIQIVCSQIQPYIDARSHQLEIIRFEGDDELNYADGERLSQVLINIIMNAIKFTPDGGKITVGGKQMPGFFEVIVTDTGIGIDLQHQQEIFNKFAQIGEPAYHSSGNSKYKGGGPGLGLFIAKGVIEAHGGSIWVDSVGRDEDYCPGSVFHILLPKRTDPLDKRNT